MGELDHTASARVVYDYSAEQFVAAVGTEVSSRFEAPLDRAVLGAFAELVSSSGPGPVLDVGCGPGRVAAFLARQGLEVRGVDISPQMIAAARLAHPNLGFDVGSLTDLPVPNHSLLGGVYWYSIIATPPSELPAVWEELDRVLDGDGHVLIAFQSGRNERDERPEAYGSSTTLTLFRHRVDDVIGSLGAAGFDVRADIRREAELPHETTPQAFLLVRR